MSFHYSLDINKDDVKWKTKKTGDNQTEEMEGVRRQKKRKKTNRNRRGKKEYRKKRKGFAAKRKANFHWPNNWKHYPHNHRYNLITRNYYRKWHSAAFLLQTNWRIRYSYKTYLFHLAGEAIIYNWAHHMKHEYTFLEFSMFSLARVKFVIFSFYFV